MDHLRLPYSAAAIVTVRFKSKWFLYLHHYSIGVDDPNSERKGILTVPFVVSSRMEKQRRKEECVCNEISHVFS